MEESFLKVENLSIKYPGENKENAALNSVSFSLERGGSLGVIGESGSGKTSLAKAVMGIFDRSVQVEGKILFQGNDLQELSEKERNPYRWSRMAMVFQNSLDILNPVLTINEQIYECLSRHCKIPRQEAVKKVSRLLEMVGLDPFVSQSYPHQLSGGMRQRILIAMALSCDPELLIVDEPTSALDAVTKDEIVQLLTRLHREKKFALIVISHEMHIISALAAKVSVLYSGHAVEEGLTRDVLKNPIHNYTRGLIYSSPSLNPFRDLWGIPGEKEINKGTGCAFYARCSQSTPACQSNKPTLEYVSIERKVACNRGGIVTHLRGKNLCKTYSFKGRTIAACENCEMEIRSGEVVVLIGESGSGKTTLAGMLSGIVAPDSGEVLFENKITKNNEASRVKNGIQIIFQDPFSSVNEQFSVEQAIREPLDILKTDDKETRKGLVIKALNDVELPSDPGFLNRKCHTLSGGQRQRVAIARSLVMEPKVLIADEISSMLDPSTQANILRLLKGLQNQKGFSMLYVTHDLPLAQKIADRVYVMYRGSIIEKGLPWEVFANPVDNYTKKLVHQGFRGINYKSDAELINTVCK